MYIRKKVLNEVPLKGPFELVHTVFYEEGDTTKEYRSEKRWKTFHGVCNAAKRCVANVQREIGNDSDVIHSFVIIDEHRRYICLRNARSRGNL